MMAATLLALTPATAASATSAAATVTVRPDHPIAALARNAIGVNTPFWNPNLVHPAVPSLIRQAGLGRLVFNGGGVSDLYHWADGSISPDPDPADHDTNYAALPPQVTFDEFASVARSAHAEMMVHVNYGTGTPTEAAQWVRYANGVKHYGVRDWEVGEEVYLNGYFPDMTIEPDAHADKSPQAYATTVVAYAQAMKAADPSIRIGVGLFAAGPDPSVYRDWNETVLRIAGHAIDFVDLHWYPSSIFGSDQADLIASTDAIPVILQDVRTMVDHYAGPRAAVVIGETNSAVAGGPDQIAQFNAVFLAVHSLDLLQNGAESVDIWALHNWSTTEGDLGLLASGCSFTGCAVADDTAYPSYFGVQAAAQVAGRGGVLVQTISTDSAVRAFASRRPDGSVVVLLVNTDPAQARRVRLNVRDGVRELAPYSLTVVTIGPGELLS
jgi:alpha-L-arabinofuranosidase